jgi:hypothetical protein
MIVDDLGRIPMSQHLAATLARAASYADAQQHPEVTLEHLLLALTEDQDAAGVLRSSNVDLARLAGEISSHIGQIAERRNPNGPAQVFISQDLKRILEAAAAAARQGRRPEINGAIVLAAIVGDGKSTAANLLRIQGLTFEQAIRALQRAASAPPARPDLATQQPATGPKGPPTGSTEDILASARERVQSRSAQPAPAPISPVEPVPPPPQPTSQPAAHGEVFGNAAPQWEPVVKPPPTERETPVSQTPPPRTGPPPAPQPSPFQVPPTQRTQPPPAPQPGGMPGPPLPAQRSAPPAPFQVPPSQVGMPPPQGRMAPPQQPRPPQPGPAGGGMPPMPTRQRRPSKNVWVAAGQFVENIPRKMRVGVSMVVEARIGRRDVKAIAEGMDNGAAVVRHEITVTKAMSVRLRSPDGGFFIESSSPETQWIEGAPGFDADYASWRWTITPRERGKRRLQLIVSARTVGDDGLTAETALPDQVIEVKVGVNLAKTAARWAGWMTAAVLGGILARFGEGLFEPLIAILRGGSGS